MNDNLTKLHSVLIEMLKDIKNFCDNNSLSFFLVAGTALGAVRHGGFIPWDDDLDIGMVYDDYLKFLKIFNDDKYYLETGLTDDFPLPYAKVKLKGTTLLEKETKNRNMHSYGIFIDIFPITDISNNCIVARFQYIASKFYIARCLARYGYQTDSKLKKIVMGVSKVFVNGFVEKYMYKFIMKKRKNAKRCTLIWSQGNFSQLVYLKEKIFPYSEIKFETLNDINIPFDVDYYLKCCFGDYMKLPPIEKRVSSHFEYLDFNRELTVNEVLNKKYLE